jgi:hypothetical protein
MNLRSPRRVLAFGLAFAATAAIAQEVRSPSSPAAMSIDEFEHQKIRIAPPELVAPGQYRIGEILLNKADKSITFPATVNMNKGLLEYLLVRTGGKTHESLLRTTIEPYNLQLACLLVGMEGTNAPLGFQGDPATPKGEAVEILLNIKSDDGKGKMISPEVWMMQVVGEAKRDIPTLHWVYTGSMVHNGRFAAQLGGSIVALYHDPAAMIDNASPGGESDKIWFVREDAAPPVGTPVMVIIRSKK